jgi:hypothetical protein
MKPFVAVVTAVVVLAACSMASAQAIVYDTYSPVVTAPSVVVESPVVVEAWRPVVTNYRYNPPVSTPSFTSYTANYGNYGAAVSYYAPYTAYSPVVTGPVTAYSPVVTSYRPVISYSPAVTTYYSPYVVRPRYYVPGQPVRNFFRAIGP